MKALITNIIFLSLFSQTWLFAQDDFEVKSGNVYRFITAQAQVISTQKQIKTSTQGFATVGEQVAIPWNAKVLVQVVDENSVQYSYLTYPDPTNFKTYNKDSPLFEMDLEDFKKYARPVYRNYKGATVGLYSVPFRLRGKGDTFDFESSLALQANLVFGFGSSRSKESFLDASVGLGLSSINLDSLNSNVTEGRTASALTISLGTVIKLNRFANLGIFVGKDFLNARDRSTAWIFNKKTWVGLGINISFNEIATNKTNAGSGQ
jgi:hypothetical protein